MSTMLPLADHRTSAAAAAGSAVSAHQDVEADSDNGDHQPADAALRGVVVDGSRIVHVDGTAALELKALSAAYRKAGVKLLFACLPGPVRDRLEAYRVDELLAAASVTPTQLAPGSATPVASQAARAVQPLQQRDAFALNWLTVEGAVRAIVRPSD